MRRVFSGALATMMILSLVNPVDSFAKTSKETVKDNVYATSTDAKPGEQSGQQSEQQSEQSEQKVQLKKAKGVTLQSQEPGQGGGEGEGGETPQPVEPTEEVSYTATIEKDDKGQVKKTEVEFKDPAAGYTRENERTAEGIKDTTSDRIHYINLDDGVGDYTSDAILIESNGHYGLIDASNKLGDTSQHPHAAVGATASGKIVLDYMEALGVEHLDFVVATHSHSDHLGGIPDIVQEMENVYGTKTTTVTSTADTANNTLNYYVDGKPAGAVSNEDELAAIKEADPEAPTVSDPVTDTKDYPRFTLVDENTTYIYKSYTPNTEEDAKGWNSGAYYTAAENAMAKTNKLLVNKTDKTAMSKIGAAYSNGGTAADNTDDYISFKFGDFDISLYNLISRSNTDENANSIVTYVEKAGTKTVLLADIDVYDTIEQKLAKAIVADHGTPTAVKIGHHGFTASTSKELIDTFNTKYAIITTENNDLSSYSPFYNYMKKKGTTLYRTVDQKGMQAIVQDMTGSLSFMTSAIGELDEGVEEYQLTSDYQTKKHYNKIYKVTKTTTTTTPVDGGEPIVDTQNEDYEVIRDYYETEVSSEVVSVSRYTGITYAGAPVAWKWNAKEGRWYKWWKNWSTYDWVFLKADGTNAIGWNTINGRLYLFDDNGIMQHGFQTYEGRRVYLRPVDNGDQPEGAPAIGWALIDGKWYFFDADGKGHNGWYNSNGDWYYIEDGLMATGIKVLDGIGYNFGSDGKLKLGWVTIGSDTYYVTGNGQYATGWIQDGSTWYCLDDSGKLLKSQWVGGYWLGSDGSWTYEGTASWKCNSKGWWYQDTNGWYPSNCWQLIDGKWYYFDGSGYLATNEWRGGCWLSSDGAWTYQYMGSWNSNGSGWWFSDESGWYAKNSWQKINGTWYYFEGDGYMATNKTIDGYYVDASGACK